VLALDLLGVCLPHRVLLGLHMPLVGPPAVGERARDTKGGLQALLKANIRLATTDYFSNGYDGL
jgi:hypothetical protein